jgi:hypothetical protein
MEDLKQRRKAPFGGRVPKKLQTAMLFRLDVDDVIWDEDGLIEDVTNPPEWLANQKVRDAIPAMLECDRIHEEMERLDVEENRMMLWLRYEIMDTQRVLLDFRGECLTYMPSNIGIDTIGKMIQISHIKLIFACESYGT